MRQTHMAFAFATLLLLAGCSGGKEPEVSQDYGAEISQTPDAPVEVMSMRREFVMMREIVRQHELQQGNDKRIEAVEKALREKFPDLPDKGATDDERRIYREAELLLNSLP